MTPSLCRCCGEEEEAREMSAASGGWASHGGTDASDGASELGGSLAPPKRGQGGRGTEAASPEPVVVARRRWRRQAGIF